LLLLLAALACGPFEDPGLSPEFDAASAKSPPPKASVAANPERSLFFGDLHIHTAYSIDAYTMGVRAMPDDAYTYARGGEIAHAGGYTIGLRRPLDFAAVTDHAEGLGMARASSPEHPLVLEPFRDLVRRGSRFGVTKAWVNTVRALGANDFADPDGEIRRAAWRDIMGAAERHNRPGEFTAFVGYEWSSMEGSANLHRNVIYRGNRAPEIPYSAIDSNDPADLWRELERQSSEGMEAFAIPHNPNLSDGRMWELQQLDGSPLDAEYMELRARSEPIAEIMQIKGNSETHPSLSPDDEFANFEVHDVLLAVSTSSGDASGGYYRDALRRGLSLSHAEGVNPFSFGAIGSSDSHNASSSVEEDKHHGKLPMMDGTAGIRSGEAHFLPGAVNRGGQWNGGGLAAVWAEENTRASLFDAMRRRETYATSGPRMSLRFFASWGYTPEIVDAPNALVRANATGVPMGGDFATLGAPPPGAAPTFLFWSDKDPDGANLDRIQIVKLGVDEAGQSYEKIFNVAASEGRRVDPATGKVPPVGNTVDVADASYENSIGARRLSGFFRDPDFDPGREAAYYARVIEIPTPRFSTYDAKLLGIEAPEPRFLRERAVSSAIFYTPGVDAR